MHENAYKEIRAFANLLPMDQTLRIADVGAQDVCGCVRPLFSNPAWTYLGLDMCAGKNVDVVLPSENEWTNIETGHFDVVVSISTLEHTRLPWLFMKEIARIVRPGGLVCINAPYQWNYHAYPIDCWRVFPDGLRAVMEWVGLTVLETHMFPPPPTTAQNGDTTGVASKGVCDVVQCDWTVLDPRKPKAAEKVVKTTREGK